MCGFQPDAATGQETRVESQSAVSCASGVICAGSRIHPWGGGEREIQSCVTQQLPHRLASLVCLCSSAIGVVVAKLGVKDGRGKSVDQDELSRAGRRRQGHLLEDATTDN